jgi:hypothetical protein
MRVSLQTARESRAIYRARLWELTTGDLLAGFGRGCMIFPATLIIGVTLFFLDTILGFFGVSLGVEMSVMLMGVGTFLSARHVYRRTEQNPFGSVVNGVYRPPLRNPKMLFLADGFLYSGLGYFFIAASFTPFELLAALSRMVRLLF